MTHARSAIISIKPQYAEAILSSQKTVELRRRIPETPRGTLLWIYATLPVGAIVGTSIVREVVRGTPSAIWDAYSQEVGISYAAFSEYFFGTDEAVAIILSEIQRCEQVSIAQLRALLNGFQPPQVLVKLSEAHSNMIRRSSEAA